jgi:hypothetical protein
MTWTILLMYALHQGDNQLIGSYPSQKLCQADIHLINSEKKPDAIVCVRLKNEVLQDVYQYRVR